MVRLPSKHKGSEAFRTNRRRGDLNLRSKGSQVQVPFVAPSDMPAADLGRGDLAAEIPGPRSCNRLFAGWSHSLCR